nr:NAC domain-containing protein 2-like [Ipomoea batatas]GMD43494.1 NAC domain-containing protein 2-like [Ipomoea batatas]
MAASCSAQRLNGYGDDDSDEWKRSLPPGHGFYPTDQELITKYLKHKAQNRKIHAGIINDLDIYNYHPEELEAAYALDHWNGRRYFFTAFKRKTKDGTRGDRAVGGGKGYWKASQARDPVKDGGGVVIGTKQPLVFHDGEGKKTSWLMSEFRYPADVDPFPLYNQIHQYFNDDGNADIFQLRVLSYDSDDNDESSSRKKRKNS